MNAPIIFTWTDDGAMVPLARFRRACDKQFAVGETYPLVIEEERSSNSHRHYFASVNEVWKNLPEDVADRFPTNEHLRKWALIKAGYCDERSIVCDTPAAAAEVAAFVRHFDGYAVITVQGTVVRAFSAKSQSVRSMPKGEFQESKTAVLDVLAALVGVTVAELAANADKAA